ncbi:MAG: hypothetical protein KGJ62_04290 [Armatimonadetes bacterium]|nr:hypothetical protein [Armatimonadota bacterium]MDE2205701.1 hypothetical protein [Armatimonadota bacterium]
MKRPYLAAAILAAMLFGSGCGGNGGGSGAVQTAQNMMVESTPRSVFGVTFLQEADHATYRTGQVMHLRFVYYLAQSQAANASIAVTFENGFDYQPVRWVLTDTRGGQTLVPPTPPGIGEGGPDGPPGYCPPDITSFLIIEGATHGFENDATAPAPGTYTLSAWSTATSTDVPGLNPPAAALQTTLYANPITIRVLP